MEETKNDILIKLENVSLRYNRPSERVDTLREYVIKLLRRQLKRNAFWVLNDINLEIKKGESLALIGLNGSGKTTLLKLIAGIVEPTKGDITIKGSIAPLISMGAGFDPEASARENVFLNGAILGYSRKEMQKKYDDIVEFSELKGSMNVPVKNFSSGMLSRLAFAIAVDVHPDILLVDEVLAVGDISFKKKCLDKIDELIKEGTTIVYVTHSMSEATRICSKALWLKNNKMEKYGDCNEVVNAYIEFTKTLN